MAEEKHPYIDEEPTVAAEPVAAVPRNGSLDGMLAYITDQNVSAALRWELGHRLIADAEHDMQVRPVFELERYLRELYNQIDNPSKPSLNIIDHAFAFVNACTETSLLSKAAVYQTDHATIMFKIVLGSVTSSVDIGETHFTYAIVNSLNALTKMGEGKADDVESIKNFYRQLKTFKQ